MKAKIVKAPRLAIALILFITCSTFVTASSSINWTRFRLFRYNSGLYLDANVSNCAYEYRVIEEDASRNMNVIYVSYDLSNTHRTWLNIPSNTSRFVEIQCVDNDRVANYWKYQVWFKDGRISASRIATGFKSISP